MLQTYIKNIKVFYNNNYSYYIIFKYTIRFILCNIFGKKYTN